MDPNPLSKKNRWQPLITRAKMYFETNKNITNGVFYEIRKHAADQAGITKRTSKILPVADTVEGLKALNRLPIRVAQKLNPQKIATLDMDNNAIATHKKNALFCYTKFKAYRLSMSTGMSMR